MKRSDFHIILFFAFLVADGRALADHMQSPLYIGPGFNAQVSASGGNLQLSNNGGTNVLSIPTITDTIATLTATQTLTNKTLTSPFISGGTISGTLSGSPTFSGGVTFASGLSATGGSAASPSITFNGSNTGFYLAATGSIGVSSAGTNIATINSNGMTVYAGASGGNVPHACTIRSASSAGTTTAAASCNIGEIVVGGGCAPLGSNTITANYPSSSTTWQCVATSAGTYSGYAICCVY